MKLGSAKQLYVIINEEFNITKIGVSDNIDVRRNTLELACGCKLTVYYKTDFLINALTYEAIVHEKFKKYRKIGEWFNVDPHKAVETIEELIKDAQTDPVVSKYRRGVPITKIASDHGVSRQAIIQKLKSFGIHNKELDNIDGVTPLKEWVRREEERKKERAVPEIKDKNKIPPIAMFLDETKPILPLHELKRIEPNISFNNEWYQISVYNNGSFTYAYTQNIDKAKKFVQDIRDKHSLSK